MFLIIPHTKNTQMYMYTNWFPHDRGVIISDNVSLLLWFEIDLYLFVSDVRLPKKFKSDPFLYKLSDRFIWKKKLVQP